MSDPITGMEVLSDAVKIGLGGLIGWLSSWTLARQTRVGELKKLEFERRTKMLSECAEGCFVHYDAVLKQFTEDRHFVDPNAKLTEPEATKAKEIRQRQIELTSKAMEATLSQFKCEAQLRLLGENLCCDSLMKYLAKSQELFDLPTSNEAEYNRVYSEKKAVADTVTDLRDAYLAELQKAFKRYD